MLKEIYMCQTVCFDTYTWAGHKRENGCKSMIDLIMARKDMLRRNAYDVEAVRRLGMGSRIIRLLCNVKSWREKACGRHWNWKNRNEKLLRQTVGKKGFYER